MCGRARCTLRPDDFHRACHLNSRPVRHLNMDRFRPSYNVAPGFSVPVVRRDDVGDRNGIVMECMKWGLIPSFTKKTEKPDHFKMFNARCESIREKASFRRLLSSNRCLVSVEGFYEWKKDGSKKQPYYIHFKDGRPLVFAALFDYWKNSEGEIIYTFTIVTTSSSSSLSWLHDRMPVILGNKESTESWLIDSSSSDLDKVLKPYGEADLVWHPVTPEMGKLSFDGPECIKEVQVKREQNKSISQFFSKKAAPGLQKPKIESNTVKEELKSVKEETEILSNLDSTKIMGEVSRLECLKEDPPTSQDTYDQSIDKKEESDAGCLSREVAHDIVAKRDFEELEFAAESKASAKETSKQHNNPVGKRSKGATDKQPTLFSYFGRS